MRVLGPGRERTEIELDPEKAWRRGRALDAMLRAALPPIRRGARRVTFADLAREELGRAREAARWSAECIRREAAPR